MSDLQPQTNVAPPQKKRKTETDAQDVSAPVSAVPAETENAAAADAVLDLHHSRSKAKEVVDLLREHFEKGIIKPWSPSTGIAAAAATEKTAQYDAKIGTVLLHQNFLQSADLTKVLDSAQFARSQQFMEIHTLVLSINSIRDVPRGLPLLASSLRQLSLANNRIAVLTTDINTLVNLEQLDLRGNRIESLDENCLSALQKLQWLSLSNNRLRSVRGLPRLEKVRFLGLFGNQLCDQDETIQILASNVPALENLMIAGNEMYLNPVGSSKSDGTQHPFRSKLLEAIPKLRYLDSHFLSENDRKSIVKK